MSGHPDAALARQVTDALDWWVGQPHTGGPTSGVTGAGAVAQLEREAAALAGVRHALALGSATAALHAALAAAGAGPGHAVLVREGDWPAGRAAARALGAPVTEVADWNDAQARATAAVLVQPGPGVVEAVGAATGACVIEDLARCRPQDGVILAGAAGVLSLGPGKALDCGEGGLLVTDDTGLWRRAVAATQHPVRQLLAGAEAPDPSAFCSRMHPVAAVLALHMLAGR